MPRPARRAKRRRDQHDENIIDHLRTGSCFGCFIEPPHTDADVRDAWEELKGIVLPEFVSEFPGRRPWAWWEFESPQFEQGRRRRIDGKMHPFEDKKRTLHVAASDDKEFWNRAYALKCGLPAVFIPRFDKDLFTDFMQNRLQGRDSEIFEAEWSFLQRNGLLLPEDSLH
jgi:hypothetical protein